MWMHIKRLRSRTRKLLRPRFHKSLEARFTYVYHHNAWRSPASVSGAGSAKDSPSVKLALTVLSQMVTRYDIRSIADVPCGDFNWMPMFHSQHPDITYIGYDIVRPLIAANSKTYPDQNFRYLDITTQIPERADMVFSKDLVNHLLERDVWNALANMVRSGATYLLITSNGDPEPNRELPANISGASRLLNLQTAPYNFPAPLYNDGYLAMWRMADLAFVMAQQPHPTSL